VAKANKLNNRQLTAKRKPTNPKKTLIRLLRLNILLVLGSWIYMTKFWTSEWFFKLVEYIQQVIG